MIAVVIGRPLSGGSALAAAIVAMGYHPGLTILGPCAPSFRLDWEDAELTPHLLSGERPDRLTWRKIIEARLLQSSALGCAGTLMKSPMLTLCDFFWEALEPYASKVFWIDREEADRQRSLKSYPDAARRTLREIDELMTSERAFDLAETAEHCLTYEDLLEDPEEALTPVAEMLGAADRLTEAVAAIGPRRLSPCRP